MTMIMIMIMIDSAFADNYDYCTELTQYYDYTSHLSLPLPLLALINIVRALMLLVPLVAVTLMVMFCCRTSWQKQPFKC